MITINTTTAARSQAHVGQAMHVGLVSCAVETPLLSVARILAGHRVHCVVVFDRGSEADEARLLWGIVSDRDVAAAVAAGAIDDQTAGSVAAEPLVTVSPAESLERAAQLMAEHGVGHLVVLDPRTHRPVGVISTLDIARVVSDLG